MLTITAILLILLVLALVVSAATGNLSAIVSMNCGGLESVLKLLAEVLNAMNSN